MTRREKLERQRNVQKANKEKEIIAVELRRKRFISNPQALELWKQRVILENERRGLSFGC